MAGHESMGQSWMVADNEQPVNVSYSGGDFMPFKNDNDNSVTVTKITSANSNSAAVTFNVGHWQWWGSGGYQRDAGWQQHIHWESHSVNCFMVDDKT